MARCEGAMANVDELCWYGSSGWRLQRDQRPVAATNQTALLTMMAHIWMPELPERQGSSAPAPVRELAGGTFEDLHEAGPCRMCSPRLPPLQNPCTDTLGSHSSTLDDVRGL